MLCKVRQRKFDAARVFYKKLDEVCAENIVNDVVVVVAACCYKWLNIFRISEALTMTSFAQLNKFLLSRLMIDKLAFQWDKCEGEASQTSKFSLHEAR
jgi:hypothetical protein